ncbi:MAG TPA: energy transducer TonB [Candidatus Elarobacter sp.]|jgi:TonB family protein
MLATLGAAPEPGASPAVAVDAWCDVAVDDVLSLAPNLLAFTLNTPGPSGFASGTLTLLTQSERYEIPFRRVVVPSEIHGKESPTPIVVHFPAAITLDAAVVTGIGTPAQPCRPYFNPYYAPHLRTGAAPKPSPHEAARLDALRRAALATTSIDATPQPYVPAACTNRFTMPKVVREPEVVTPRIARDQRWTGTTWILVTIGTDGSPLEGRVYSSSGFAELDAYARSAIVAAKFTAGTFDCAPTVGSYLFCVNWNG